MASYHFSAQIIGRAKGRSAIAAAAYRSGSRLRDEETGQEHDYSRRHGIVHTEILLPQGAAAWLADREKLWNHVHQIERRKDAQLAREFNVALPHELSADERLALVRDFAREHFGKRGMVADLAIHAPTDNDPRNHHAHIMVTLRKATPSGLYRVKTREWNSDSMLKAWREAWADMQNRALERGRHPARVDHRTLATQQAEARARGDRAAAAALDRAPEIHVGPRAQQAVRRGHTPRSRTREQASARPAAGAWRSSARSGTRRRTVDYPRIDQGSRPAYNAARAAIGAERVARRVAQLQRRETRLRLIELRLSRGLRQAEEGLRAVQRDRQAPFWQRPGAPQLAAREAHFTDRLKLFRRRSQLLRQLLQRTDGILAGLFMVHNHALSRSRTLEERTLQRVLTPVMALTRQRGRGRSRWMPA